MDEESGEHGTPSVDNMEEIVFASHFEGGNLRRVRASARRVSSATRTPSAGTSATAAPTVSDGGSIEYHYHLRVCADNHGTPQEVRGNRAYFRFCVYRVPAGATLVLTVANIAKAHRRPFLHGLRPCIAFSPHSGLPEEDDPEGWPVLDWQLIPDLCRCKVHKGNFQLRFTIRMPEFPTPHVLHVASWAPYTYTDLQRFLGAMDEVHASTLAPLQPFYTRELLVRTRQGRRVDLLTITGASVAPSKPLPRPPRCFPKRGNPERPPAFEYRRVVCVCARVHPGEASTSRVIEGLVRFLLSSHPHAIAARERFVFKILPMLCPDAVAAGRLRTDHRGVNVNRTYATARRKEAPGVAAWMAVLRMHAAAGRLAVFVDLHAHAQHRTMALVGNAHAAAAAAVASSMFALSLASNCPFFDLDNAVWAHLPGSNAGVSSRALCAREVVGTHLDVVHAYTLDVNHALFGTRKGRDPAPGLRAVQASAADPATPWPPAPEDLAGLHAVHHGIGPALVRTCLDLSGVLSADGVAGCVRGARAAACARWRMLWGAALDRVAARMAVTDFEDGFPMISGHTLDVPSEWLAQDGVTPRVPVSLVIQGTRGIVSKRRSVAIAQQSTARDLGLSFRIHRVNSGLMRTLLVKNGFFEAPADNTIPWSLFWVGRHIKPSMLSQLAATQRINHFPMSSELTRKDRLWRNIQLARKRHPSAPFDFVPDSYCLPGDFGDLQRRYPECGRHGGSSDASVSAALPPPWILKPSCGSCGRGIQVLSSLRTLERSDEGVLQQYINNPLLINNHKFDMRLYVLVTSYTPLRVYLYDDGLGRFACEPYDGTSTMIDRPWVHLTNVSLNRKHPNFVRNTDANVDDVGSVWSLTAVRRHLATMGVDVDLVWARIRQLIVESLAAVAPRVIRALDRHAQHPANCFELYGYDVLIDDACKPWLLEVNAFPSINCGTPLDLRIKSGVVSELLSIVGFEPIHFRPHGGADADGQGPGPGQGRGREQGKGGEQGRGREEREQDMVARATAEMRRTMRFDRIYPVPDGRYDAVLPDQCVYSPSALQSLFPSPSPAPSPNQ